MQIGEIDDGETGSSSGSGLKQTIEESETYGQAGDGFVVKLNRRSVKHRSGAKRRTYIENDEKEQIDTV
jgi:hypothetical protein